MLRKARMKHAAEISILTVLLICCCEALDRNAVRERVITHRLSLLAANMEPFFVEEAARRRIKRQAFLSDDEDDGGSGNSTQDAIVAVSTTQSYVVPEQPPAAPTDWVWYRASINFLDSIEYNGDLADYNTDAFARLSNEIMVDIERYLQTQLEGYHEATPLMYSQVNDDVIALIDVGLCNTHSINDVTNALTSLISGGQIGRFRVSEDGFSIRPIGIDSGRPECVPGPTLPTPNVPPPRASESPLVETTTEQTLPEFDLGFSTTSTPRTTLPPPCRPDQATCRNRRCIDRSYVCDGANDCLDFSDEPESCTVTDQCDPTEFLCIGTGVCAQLIWRCDGDDDCGNGYDELNCPTASSDARCASMQFECRNRVCIPSSYHCDGQPDCEDGSDEEGCSPPVIVTPPKHLVSAVEGETVTLECEAVGVPNPVISWRLNWGNVPPAPRVTMTSVNGKGVLTIRKIKLLDQGAYTCEAINPNGSILGTPDSIVSVTTAATEKPATTTEPSFPYEPAGPPDADAGLCPPGEYNTSPDYPDECKPCWCSNVSDECVSSKLEFTEVGIEFTEPNDKKGVTLEPVDPDGNPEGFQPVTEHQIDVNPPARELQLIDLSKRFLAAAHYWSLPAQFLGAKINSYGGTLTFSFSYENSYHTPSVPTNHTDVILEGGGKKLLYKRPGPHPKKGVKHTTQVALEEDQFTTSDGDPVSRDEFLDVLGNIDRVLLRTVYDKSMLSTGIGNITLQVAKPSSFRGDGGEIQNAGVIAHAVEECVCPPGYDGLSCETCSNNYERIETGPSAGKCRPSELQDAPGFDLVCDVGYTGRYCKECDKGYTLYKGECTLCDPVGTAEAKRGQSCQCKSGSEGTKCDRCKPGYYFLSEINPNGCLKCYCMGVSNECHSTTWNRTKIAPALKGTHYFTITNEAMTETFPHTIRLETELDGERQPKLTAQTDGLPSGFDYYWVLPKEFLGNKLSSYGGKLEYTVSFTTGHNSWPNTRTPDIRLTGNGVTLEYYGSLSPIFNADLKYVVDLTEENWLTSSVTRASRENLMNVLSNVESFLIKATYTSSQETVTIKNIRMDAAVPRHTGEFGAYAVEQCSCPTGYTGLSCEDCAEGYTKSGSEIYPGVCAPCECNGHADLCDPSTGVCINCQHNTAGKRCEFCARGFFGVATRGTRMDCRRQCACPGTGTNSFSETCRLEASTNTLTCTACQEGYTGQRCENCAPGYEGSPTEPGGQCRRRAARPAPRHLPEVAVSPKSVNAKPRSSVTIRCTVNSHSPTAVRWRRGDSNHGPLPRRAVVTNRGRTLRLRSFSSSQVGTYQCVARNRFGSSSDSASVALERQRALTRNRPTIRVRVEEPTQVRVRVGSQVTFVCTASSKMPAFIVSWTKQDSMLPLSRATDFEGILRINDVQQSDSGTYVCTGSNMHETDRQVATLLVI